MSPSSTPSLDEQVIGWTIVHVLTQLDLGGAQLATLDEVEDLAKRARTILMYGRGGQLDAEVEQRSDFEQRPLRFLGRSIRLTHDLLAFGELLLTLGRLRLESRRLCVHTHSTKAGLLGRAAAAVVGADCIVHSIHGFGHGPGREVGAWAQAFEVAVGLVTDAFTGDSCTNLAEARTQSIVTDQATAFVPCGIDIATFAPSAARRTEARSKLGLDPKTKVVVTIANLKPQKDPLATVDVAREVLEAHPEVVFLFAGDGPLRHQVEQASRGLGTHFRLLGWRRDVPTLLAAADLFLLTSRWEGLPQAIFQAMASGLPVVATDVDGNREAVDDGVTGFLAPPGATSTLSTYVKKLIADDELARRMSMAAQVASADFDRTASLARLRALYAELMSPMTPSLRRRRLDRLRARLAGLWTRGTRIDQRKAHDRTST